MSLPEPTETPRTTLATVAALDVDGIGVVTVGTGLFGVATVILALAHGWLALHGHLWWLGVSGSGVALGVIGLAYCRRRRRIRHS